MSRRWGKLFVGLFIFLGPGRLVRPVRCLRTGQTEWIGRLGRQLVLTEYRPSRMPQRQAIGAAFPQRFRSAR